MYRALHFPAVLKDKYQQNTSLTKIAKEGTRTGTRGNIPEYVRPKAIEVSLRQNCQWGGDDFTTPQSFCSRKKLRQMTLVSDREGALPTNLARIKGLLAHRRQAHAVCYLPEWGRRTWSSLEKLKTKTGRILFKSKNNREWCFLFGSQRDTGREVSSLTV